MFIIKYITDRTFQYQYNSSIIVFKIQKRMKRINLAQQFFLISKSRFQDHLFIIS